MRAAACRLLPLQFKVVDGGVVVTISGRRFGLRFGLSSRSVFVCARRTKPPSGLQEGAFETAAGVFLAWSRSAHISTLFCVETAVFVFVFVHPRYSVVAAKNGECRCPARRSRCDRIAILDSLFVWYCFFCFADASSFCRTCYFNTPLYLENNNGSYPDYPDCPCCVLETYPADEAANLAGPRCEGRRASIVCWLCVDWHRCCHWFFTQSSVSIREGVNKNRVLYLLPHDLFSCGISRCKPDDSVDHRRERFQKKHPVIRSRSGGCGPVGQTTETKMGRKKKMYDCC